MTPAVSRLFLGFVVLAGSACAREPERACSRLGALCLAMDRALRFDDPRAASASSDLDGDGALDLVTATPGFGLTIAWGKEPQRDFRVYPAGAADVGLADVDGDGDTDVVFVTAEPPQLHVLDNTGGRVLPEIRTIDVEGRPESLWVGALDGDGTPDAVVATSVLGGLTIFTDGLEHRKRVALGEDLVAVEVADLEDDGRLDIVAADYSGSALYVVPAQNAGEVAPVRSAAGPAPELLQLSDLDGDGLLDAWTHGRAGPEVWLHAGLGGGAFAPPRTIDVLDVPSPGFAVHRDARGASWVIAAAHRRLIASEVDTDGRVVRRVMNGEFANTRGAALDGDAALAHGERHIVRYSLEPALMFTEVWNGLPSSLDTSKPLVLGDFVEDGLLDVAVLSGYGEITIHVGRPDGTWEERETFEVPRHTLWLDADDVTGDGKLDLVLGVTTPEVQIAVGHGDGTFELAPPVLTKFDAWTLHTFKPFGTAAAAVAVSSDVHGEPGVELLRFDAAGAVVSQATPAIAGAAIRLASADVDGDGREELVALVLSDAGPSIEVLAAQGDAWVTTTSRSLAELQPMVGEQQFLEAGLGVGDLDEDGTVDAILVVEEALVRLHDFAAGAPPPAQIDPAPTASRAEQVMLAHADDDGVLDVVYFSYSGFEVALGSADGTLRSQTRFDEFVWSGDLRVDPIDRRVTGVLLSDRGVSVLRSGIGLALESKGGFFATGPAGRLATGDVDADGTVDVVVSNPSDNWGGGFGVLWGGDGSQGRAGLGMAAYSSGAVGVAELDGRPGAEVMVARANDVKVWTFVDGMLRELGGTTSAGSEIIEVAALARAGGSADVLVLGRNFEPPMLRVVALERTDGDATAWGPGVVLWEGPEGTVPPAMTVVDLDGDGFSDVALAPGEDQPVQVVWGDAGRSAVVTPLALEPARVRTLASGDMNGDGLPELVVGGAGETVAIGFVGRKQQAPARVGLDCDETRMVIADVDDDGVFDIVCERPHSLMIDLRDPAGAGPRLRINGAESPWTSTQAVGLDSDGILDLVGIRDGALVTLLSDEGGR